MGPALQAFIGRAVEDAGPYEILSVNGAKSSAVRRDAGRRSFCDCQNPFMSHRFAKKQKALENAEEKSETAQKEDEE